MTCTSFVRNLSHQEGQRLSGNRIQSSVSSETDFGPRTGLHPGVLKRQTWAESSRLDGDPAGAGSRAKQWSELLGPWPGGVWIRAQTELIVRTTAPSPQGRGRELRR